MEHLITSINHGIFYGILLGCLFYVGLWLIWVPTVLLETSTAWLIRQRLVPAWLHKGRHPADLSLTRDVMNVVGSLVCALLVPVLLLWLHLTWGL